jgi:hypothetical protein
MAIDQTNVVDSIGVDPKTNETQLIIADHLRWWGSEREDREHMYLLQEKINSYLRFIESGEICAAFPQSQGEKLTIRIVGKYDIPASARDFLDKVQKELLAAGYRISFERLASP